MKYKPEQTTALLRRRNSIRTFKVLGIKGNDLIIRNSYDRGKTAAFTVSEPDNYKIGGYVDMVFVRRGSSSYAIQLIGHTPPEFTPDNGQDIV